MKLKALTNNKTIKEKNNSSKTKKKSKIKNTSVNLLPLSLSLEISKNYEGLSDNIGGVLDTLPIPIKTLFTNSELKKVSLRQGNSIFVLDNGFTIFIKEVTIKKIVKKEIKIKHKKHYVFNGVVD